MHNLANLHKDELVCVVKMETHSVCTFSGKFLFVEVDNKTAGVDTKCCFTEKKLVPA